MHRNEVRLRLVNKSEVDYGVGKKWVKSEVFMWK